MTHILTPEQLDALRAVPLIGMPNKVRLALALSRAKQVDIVKAVPTMEPWVVSRIVKGDYVGLPLEHARAIAEFFGAHIEDLFPAQSTVSGHRDQSALLFVGKKAMADR